MYQGHIIEVETIIDLQTHPKSDKFVVFTHRAQAVVLMPQFSGTFGILTQWFLCTRAHIRAFLCCDIQRLPLQRERLVFGQSRQESGVTLHTQWWPSFEVNIMSLWEMQSQDGTSSLGEAALAADALLSNYSSLLLLLLLLSAMERGREREDKEKGRRSSDRLWSEGQ